MALRLVTAPATEPVSLVEVKLYLRVTASDEDALIADLIAEAREAAEHELGRSLMTQTLEKALDMFPAAIRLDYPPVASIASIKYLDEDGTEQTLSSSSYTLDNASDSAPAWVTPAPGYAWPDTYAEVNAVKVQYVAGTETVADIPASVKGWVRSYAVMLYQYRGDDIGRSELEIALRRSLQSNRYRIWSL